MMPALNFKPEFADAVEAGTKLQTIRLIWIHPIKVGDTVYLKTGMRTKKCRALNEGIVESVEPIRIIKWNEIFLSDKCLSSVERFYLIRDDGFFIRINYFCEDVLVNKFYEFFQNQYGLPFEGVLIKWRLK